MLTRENFSKEYIEELRLDSGNDPALLERVLYAFGLLGSNYKGWVAFYI